MGAPACRTERGNPPTTAIDMAEQKATDDWNQQRVFYRVVGTVGTDVLQLDKDHPFFTVSVGSSGTEQQLLECESYNKAINDLLRRNGTPVWAPFRRVPDRTAALLLLSEPDRLADA